MQKQLVASESKEPKSPGKIKPLVFKLEENQGVSPRLLRKVQSLEPKAVYDSASKSSSGELEIFNHETTRKRAEQEFLKSRRNNIDDHVSGAMKCEDMLSTLNYVLGQKIDYYSEPDNLRTFLKSLISSQKIIQNQFEIM